MRMSHSLIVSSGKVALWIMLTPRRWLRLANPMQSALITEAIGQQWLTELERLQALERFADDAAFRGRWHSVKAL